MRALPILGMLVVSGVGAIRDADADATAVPGLLERAIPAGSPPRPSRFVEGDRGDPIPYLVDLDALPDGITDNQALSAIENAFAAWGEATGLRFVLESTVGFGRPASDFSDPDGRIRIQCHDSYGAISESQVLGIGGSGSISGGFADGGFGGRVFDEEFHRTVRGYVIVNHRHPLLELQSTFEEVICHEVGHLLGLEHSSATYPEPDPVLREALMYVRVHADGRGASLGEYDRVTAQKAYPTAARPPGVFPATMKAVSVAGGVGAPDLDANSIKLATIDLDTPAGTLEAVLHPSSTGDFGSFSLQPQGLIYQPGPDIDEPQLDPSGEGYYDRAFFRFHDGVHSSAYESVRVIQIARDSYPTIAPDGLPDTWMLEHFGDIVPVAGISGASDDPDEDGCKNLDEFLQETDPMDALSKTQLSFSVSSPTAAGEGRLVLVSLSANRPLARTIDLSAVLGGSAQGGGIDFSTRGWTTDQSGILWPTGRKTRTLMLELADDGLEEIDETIEIALEESPGVILDEPTSNTVIISGDVLPPIYDFAAATTSASERNGLSTTTQITATRSGNLEIASSVLVEITAATEGSAAAPEPVLIEFAPGETSATAAVAVTDDRVDEPTELLQLSFSEFLPFGVSGSAQPTAELLIYDDDDPPRASVMDASVNEAAGTLSFVVSLDEISAFPITLHYWTSPGSATPSVDYSSEAGELLIPPGALEGVIYVPLINDLLDESDETIELVLGDARQATIADDRAIGMILDNDPLPRVTLYSAAGAEDSGRLQFLVRLSAPSGREITLNYSTVDQSAVAGSDYLGDSGIVTLPAGETSQLIDVPLLRDCTDEETETFTLSLSAPTNVGLAGDQATGTIFDAPPLPCLSVIDSMAGEGDGVITFPVQLSMPLDSSLSVPYRIRSGSAEVGGDILESPDQILVFPAGTTETSASVTVLEDSIDEEDEQFILELLIDASSELRRAEPGQGTIIDNDAPSRIELQPAGGTESSGLISAVLRIEPPSGKEIRILYETGDGTAVEGDDYEALDGSLIIPPLTGEAVVQLRILDDSRVEPSESILFKLRSWENVEHDGTGVPMTVLDDDSPSPPNLLLRNRDDERSLSIQWQGLEGALYELEVSDDLHEWRPLDVPLRVRASGLVDVIDGIQVVDPRGFYRIIEVAPNE